MARSIGDRKQRMAAKKISKAAASAAAISEKRKRDIWHQRKKISINQ